MVVRRDSRHDTEPRTHTVLRYSHDSQIGLNAIFGNTFEKFAVIKAEIHVALDCYAFLLASHSPVYNLKCPQTWSEPTTQTNPIKRHQNIITSIIRKCRTYCDPCNTTVKAGIIISGKNWGRMSSLRRSGVSDLSFINWLRRTGLESRNRWITKYLSFKNTQTEFERPPGSMIKIRLAFEIIALFYLGSYLDTSNAINSASSFSS